MMKLTVPGILMLAVLAANAGIVDIIGVHGGINHPLSTATSDRYSSCFFIEPFIGYAPSEHLRIEISGGVTILDEDNWWSESYSHSTYDYDITTSETSITISLKSIQGNTFFAAGISNVWRHFTATATPYGYSSTINDEYRTSDIGYMLGTGFRISSFASLILQARVYGRDDAKFLFGVGFNIPLGGKSDNPSTPGIT